MAQGDFFELSVAYPLKNHKFRLPTYYEGLLVSQGTSPADNITFTNSVSEGVVVGPGDRLQVTDAVSGQVHNFIVAKAAYTYPLLTAEIRGLSTGSIATNSIGVIRGSKKAGGWDRTGTSTSTATEAQRAVMLGTEPYGGGSNSSGKGRFAQIFRSGPSQLASTPVGIDQTLLKEKISPYTYYRIGFNYKMEIVNISGAAALITNLKDSAVTYPSQTISQVDVLDWTVFTGSPFFVRENDGTNTPKLQILTEIASGLDEVTVWVSDAVLEHARQIKGTTRVKNATNAGGAVWTIVIYDKISTVGLEVGQEIAVTNRNTNSYAILSVTNISSQTASNFVATFQSGNTSTLTTDAGQDSSLEIKNNGSFTFTDTPLQSSIDYRPLEETRTTKLLDTSVRIFSPASVGARSERWSFRCRFTTFPQEDWFALMNLLRWQQNGNLLALRTFLDDVPQPMVGRLVLANVRKATHWDLYYRDFDFIFVEASL